MSKTRMSSLWEGVRATLPLLPSVMPFGMLYGALALAAGLPTDAALAMSPLVYAGSAQFLAATLISGGAPWLVVLLTTLVVNLRHVLYGISIAPHVHELPLRWKALLAYFLTDETYALAIANFNRSDQAGRGHWFTLGSGLVLWSCWQLSTVIGVAFGSQIPASWDLDFALPLTFIALVVPWITARPAALAALAAAGLALALVGLPLKLGLMAAALGGIAVGMAAERIWGAPEEARS